ncbi:unnamed protein product [Rotaria sordida]|uniref:Uncharacterized protein n=1 Tax=Rotaria sordida TaxID=392033 RepID=A0A815YRX8_9BILA|nr:unnamed protein product [Rotaria sordida]CAF1573484.1 unnamed protein product [Rotaria sordida]
MDLPLNLVTFFNRYSKEELHQIGISIIQYSQQFVNKQNHDIPPLQSHRSSNNPSSIIPPPLMDQQPQIISIFSPTQSSQVGQGRHKNSEDFYSKTTRFKNYVQAPSNQQFQQQANATTNFTHPRQRFNINTLKRAVTNHLPAFHIMFDPSIDINNIPSSTQVAIMLKKAFIDNKLPIKELSLCT